MKGIAGGFQIIYEFVATFFIHSKITLLLGQNRGQICHLLRESLDQLPIGQINNICQFPSTPLNVLRNQGFIKIFEIL